MEEKNNLLKNQENKKVNEVALKPETEKKSNAGMFAGVSSALIVLVVVISVVVTMGMQRNNNNDKSGTGNYSIIDDNTELGSGSVTTTIGGKSITYKGAYVVDGVEATISSGTYESASDDEVVFLVINGGSLRIDGEVTINKSGSEDFAGRGDNYSFYGINSAIVVVGDGSSAEINGAKINTTVSGANAIVATDGATAVVSGAEISTTKDNSRGLHATYGGTINADNTKITTQGGSCAALATDRGTGTVVADNMTLSTAGAGSPLIYSTGNISVTNSTGVATGAQIAVVEGKNSISLQGCEFSANGNGNRNGVDNAGVMIYQSMSGDASVGTGSFTATDCTLTVLASSSVYNVTPFFFITNTDATIDLTGTSVSFSAAEKFISALGTSEWGRSGNNGGKVTVTLSDVNTTNTEVETDSISSVSGI
ncbi:MAG: hypothetical protein Q4C24_03220 [Candidatus Saccharibacteria bacterium]|nr:hypothetical protein [Candidatus Saccharibacteria bacterium]